MPENYKIISDLEHLQKYIDTLEQDKHYIVQLAIRDKYADYPVSKNYNVLRKELLKPNKIVSFLKSCECAVGSYETHKHEPILNNTGFVCYISANWIDTTLGHKKIASELSNTMLFGQTQPRHITEYVLSQMFKCNDRTFLDLDYDYADINLVEYSTDEITALIQGMIIDCVGDPSIVHFIRTKGGVHALVKTKDIPIGKKKTAIKYLKEDWVFKCDVASSGMSHAIPGTYQGGFPVQLLTE